MFTISTAEAQEEKQKETLSIDIDTLILELLNDLKENEKDIVIKRFGLLRHKRETLAQIGCDKGVTRERIRQIEQESIQKLQDVYSRCEKLRFLRNCILDILEEYGGLMREDHFLNVLSYSINDVNDTSGRQSILFILIKIFKTPNFLKNHTEFHNSWYLSEAHLDRAKEIVGCIENKILAINELLDEVALEKILDEINVGKKIFNSYLRATRKIEQNIFGQWGFASWPSVAPKRVSDKAYLVFKQVNKPLHFKELADLINKLAFSDKKISNLGTVHNELIIDDRYVLIGRGIYALKEWGYFPGAVRDLIVKLLKENGAMHRDEIIERISKQRVVGDNTIRVALIDKSLFKKIGKNIYQLADNG